MFGNQNSLSSSSQQRQEKSDLKPALVQQSSAQDLCGSFLKDTNSTFFSGGLAIRTAAVKYSPNIPSIPSQAPTKPSLLESAFGSTGSASYELLQEISDLLENMETSYQDYGSDCGNSFDDTADLFCGSSKEELIQWHTTIPSSSQGNINCSTKTKSLLLRAFFDSQRNYLIEKKYMESKQYPSSALQIHKEMRAERHDFLCQAEVHFEAALWKHLVTEWAPTAYVIKERPVQGS